MEEDVSRDVEKVIKIWKGCGGRQKVGVWSLEKCNASFVFKQEKTEDLGNYRLFHSKFCHGQKNTLNICGERINC